MPKGIWGNRQPAEIVPCEFCGKIFRYYQSAKRQGKKQRCSRMCRDKARHVIFEPTARQMEILNGSLLGDGSLCRSRTAVQFKFTKRQRHDREDYIRWHCDELLPLPSNVWCGGNVREWKGEQVPFFNVNMETWVHPVFTELREKWYPNGTKIVPDDLELSPLTVAIWFCDDGTNVPTERKAAFATDSFAIEDVEHLRAELARLGIEAHIWSYSARKYKPTLGVACRSYKDLIDMIAPHVIWESMRHKTTLEGYRPARPMKWSPHVTDEMLVQSRHIYGSWRKAGESLGLTTSCTLQRVCKRRLNEAYRLRYGFDIARRRG